MCRFIDFGENYTDLLDWGVVGGIPLFEYIFFIKNIMDNIPKFTTTIGQRSGRLIMIPIAYNSDKRDIILKILNNNIIEQIRYIKVDGLYKPLAKSCKIHDIYQQVVFTFDDVEMLVRKFEIIKFPDQCVMFNDHCFSLPRIKSNITDDEINVEVCAIVNNTDYGLATIKYKNMGRIIKTDEFQQRLNLHEPGYYIFLQKITYNQTMKIYLKYKSRHLPLVFYPTVYMADIQSLSVFHDLKVTELTEKICIEIMNTIIENKLYIKKDTMNQPVNYSCLVGQGTLNPMNPSIQPVIQNANMPVIQPVKPVSQPIIQNANITSMVQPINQDKPLIQPIIQNANIKSMIQPIIQNANMPVSQPIIQNANNQDKPIIQDAIMPMNQYTILNRNAINKHGGLIDQRTINPVVQDANKPINQDKPVIQPVNQDKPIIQNANQDKPANKPVSQNIIRPISQNTNNTNNTNNSISQNTNNTNNTNNSINHNTNNTNNSINHNTNNTNNSINHNTNNSINHNTNNTNNSINHNTNNNNNINNGINDDAHHKKMKFDEFVDTLLQIGHTLECYNYHYNDQIPNQIADLIESDQRDSAVKLLKRTFNNLI